MKDLTEETKTQTLKYNLAGTKKMNLGRISTKTQAIHKAGREKSKGEV